MLKKIIKLNLDDFGIAAAVMGGAFLLLELIVNIIMAAVHPDSVPTLGGILLPATAFMLCLFINVFQVPVGFDFMLRFGITRRSSLAGLLSLMIGETVFAFLLAGVLVQADRLIAWAWMWARPELELESFSVPLWGYAVMAAAAVALGLISGAVIERFGRKAMWILWIAFMGIMTVMNATGWEIVDAGVITPVGIAAIAIALLAGIVWAVWILLKACVKN